MTSFSRRALLRGLAAGAGGLALVPIMSRLTGAQHMPTSRFVFIVEGNCFEPVTMLADNARSAIDGSASSPVGTNRWWPDLYNHSSALQIASTQFNTAPALGALQGSPIAMQSAVLFGMSSKIAGGGHSAEHGVLSSSRTLSGSPGGITIDAYLGALSQVRQNTPYDVVRLGVNADTSKRLDFGTCAFDRARPAPLILQPTAAFNVLFGSVSSASATVAFARRGRLFDFASADVNASLATFSGNSAERAKLESYLASLQVLTQRQQRILALDATLRAVRPQTPDMNPLYAHNDVLDRFSAQLELALAALKGDLTNVVVIGSGTGGDFDMTYPTTATPTITRHNLHHGSATNPAYLATIHEVTRRQVNAIVAMATNLASTPDPIAGGMMLDHTVIVYIGDNGEQHHSTASEFPVLVIGGTGMGIRTGGRTIVYPGLSSPNHRQVSNLWNTLGHAAGDMLDTFGAEARARIAPGPLSELFG